MTHFMNLDNPRSTTTNGNTCLTNLKVDEHKSIIYALKKLKCPESCVRSPQNSSSAYDSNAIILRGLFVNICKHNSFAYNFM